MTREEYFEGIKRLGLMHEFESTYRTVNGDPVWVQSPDKLTPEAMAENFEKLAKRTRDEF